MQLSSKEELQQWSDFVNWQTPRWCKVKVINAKTLEALVNFSSMPPTETHITDRYWKFIKQYAQRLNDECETGYFLSESVRLERGVCHNLHHTPTYQAFWFSDNQYVGYMAAFFNLDDNLFQSLILREKCTLLITFSRTRGKDFHCPNIHLVIQDGKYKRR